jgi:large subunit ribosomal protein L23
MSFFNKIVKKSNKSDERFTKSQQEKADKSASAKADLSIAELKAKQSEVSKDEKKVVRKAEKKEDTKNAYKVLLRPIVTEKGSYMASHNKYLFEVSLKTNKIEIKKAIKAVYGIDPIAVNIVNLSGKKVRYGKTKGVTKDRKKAIVTLPKGQAIEIYEGV